MMNLNSKDHYLVHCKPTTKLDYRVIVIHTYVMMMIIYKCSGHCLSTFLFSSCLISSGKVNNSSAELYMAPSQWFTLFSMKNETRSLYHPLVAANMPEFQSFAPFSIKNKTRSFDCSNHGPVPMVYSLLDEKVYNSKQ